MEGYVFDKFSNRSLNLKSICELNSRGVKLTSLLPLNPNSFNKNECDKYKVSHMLSFR